MWYAVLEAEVYSRCDFGRVYFCSVNLADNWRGVQGSRCVCIYGV